MTEETSRKKILLVTRPIAPPWDEASKNFAFYLAKNLSAFDFYLLTNGFIPDLPPHIHQKAIYTSNKLTYMQRVRLLKLRHILREDFNVIHYMLTPTRLNAFSFKTFIKNNRSRTIQTIATLREDLFKDKDFKNILFADLIITYSDYAKNKLNSLGFKNVKRVYPGIDLEEYKYAPKDQKLMKQENISENDFVINFTGEYTRLGAMDLVIDSFIEISKKIPEAKLALAVRVKNDKDAQKKKEVVKKLKLKENNLLEKVSFFDDGSYKMAPVYNLCDISLFPVTDMKGKFDVPLAVIEAMACEKPVIISDLPILSEFANKDNSVIIKRGNIAALSKAILDLYGNAARRQEIGQNARKFVEENFDIKDIAEIYRKIYEKL
jgi:glycosyltransferase involved in cell wall biosynthesis